MALSEQILLFLSYFYSTMTWKSKKSATNTSSLSQMLSRIDLFFSKKNTYWISNRRKKSNWEGRRAGRCSFVIWFIFGHFNLLNPFIMATPVEWIATDVLEKYFASLRNWFLSHSPFWNKVLGPTVTESGDISISSGIVTMSVTYLYN